MRRGKPISQYNRTLDWFKKFKINGKISKVWNVRIDNNTWILGDDAIYLSKGQQHTFDKINVIDKDHNHFPSDTDNLMSIDNTGTLWIYKINFPAGISIFMGRRLSDSLLVVEALNKLSLAEYKSYYMHNLSHRNV
jgi:hypothetical protein